VVLFDGTLLQKQFVFAVEYKNRKGPVQYTINVGLQLGRNAYFIVILVHQNHKRLIELGRG
jgi:hypothetical protein